MEEFDGYSTIQDVDVVLKFDKSKKSDGCLVSSWTKKENNEGKYSGDFALLWAFSQENQGFITYVSFSFYSHGQEKAQSTGGVYTLSKTNENKWKMSAKKEVRGAKYITEWHSKLPKARDDLSEIKDLFLWGIGDQETNSNNLIKDVDITEDQETEKKGGSYWRWEWNKDETGTIGSWSSNLSTWWSEMFADGKNNIPEIVKEVTGRWTKIDIK